MGIANTFTFGGVNTTDYGLIVEGSGDYSAPKRAVETIEIPGRNGAYQLDKGYYENIEVEYSVVVKDATQADFRESIDAFRNAIVSQTGYQRLEDTYHPGEYRMAMYAGGLDEDASFHGNGAIFKIKFDCRPQRYLTEGEEEIAVESGDLIVNPTLFEAYPMIDAKGYGRISFNGYSINLRNSTMGTVQILNDVAPNYDSYDPSGPITAVYKTDTIPVTAYANTGDPFTASVAIDLQMHILFAKSTSAASITTAPAIGTAGLSRSGTYLNLSLQGLSLEGTFGTDASVSDSCVVSATYKHVVGDRTVTDTTTVSVTISYAASTNVITVTVSTTNVGFDWDTSSIKEYVSLTANSSISILGDPTHIDCDLGEAYKIVNGTFVSLNGSIDLGSKLPSLGVDVTEITFDNTITELKVIPRWWKI